MPTDILMPKLADTLVEGTVARWLKAVHDPVQAGESLAEIETDKVTTELTAPAAGRLSEVLVAAGQTVPIGTLLARIRAEDEVAPAQPAPAVPAPAVSPPAEQAESLSPHQGAASKKNNAMERGPESETMPGVTPLAARMARDHGIDLHAVSRSGDRITRADIEQHLAQAGRPQPAVPSSGGPDLTSRFASAPASAPLPRSAAKKARGELLPLTGLRRATAARMAAVQQIPTGTAIVEADATALVDAYQQERDPWLAREGFPLTYTPYFLYALAQTLRAWPAVRATRRDGQGELRDEVHVGVAVALDDGLIVPVVRDADRQDIPALAHTLAGLVARARSRRLQPDDLTGGIATLTNVGSLGGLLALPMLNENQATMLGVGAVTRRAVGNRQGIRYRYRVYLSLTFDRRLVDDLLAERFLLDVARAVAQPSW
jgi:pyruvate dehydrogenase E2 component (dihydrolipoamide acetyltransferase)